MTGVFVDVEGEAVVGNEVVGGRVTNVGAIPRVGVTLGYLQAER